MFVVFAAACWERSRQGPAKGGSGGEAHCEGAEAEAAAAPSRSAVELRNEYVSARRAKEAAEAVQAAPAAGTEQPRDIVAEYRKVLW